VKPAPFDYFAPGTLDEALALLAEHGDEAKPLAGGQSLIPAMNFRLARPRVLVDLNRVAALSYVRSEKGGGGGGGGGGVEIGAMTRQRAVERSDVVARAAPLLAEAMPAIAHPQIRNRGTVGGSIAHADPSAELPAVALALDARFRARSATGERTIVAADFFKGMLETALEPGELLVEIALPPLRPRTGTAFLEVARRHGDYALVGVAAVVTLDATGRCQAARIAFLSVGDGPVLAVEAGKTLVGQKRSDELLRAAADAAAKRDVDPPSDIHASAAYRRRLVEVLTRRALARAFERAEIQQSRNQ
jgi:aerobic carbon-monoxide dehydrogenase medium subunit